MLHIHIQDDLSLGPVFADGVEGHDRGRDQRPWFTYTRDPHQLLVRNTSQICPNYVTVTLIYLGLLRMDADHLLSFVHSADGPAPYLKFSIESLGSDI